MNTIRWYVWFLLGAMFVWFVGFAVDVLQGDYDLQSMPTPAVNEIAAESMSDAMGWSRLISNTPTPEPTPRAEPLPLVIQVSSIGDRYGACSGWVYTARPLPEGDRAFIAPFRMLKREYPPTFVGDGYSYYVASNPLWGCAAMKAALKKATGGG